MNFSVEKMLGTIPLDFIPQLSKILVGFLVFCEILIFFLSQLLSIVSSLKGFLNLDIKIIPLFILLVFFYLIGHIFVSTFTFLLNLLIALRGYVSKKKFTLLESILNSVIGFFYPLNPLVVYSNAVKADYKKKIIKKIATSFNLQDITPGFELWWLARELVLKQYKLISIHKLEFEDNLSRGLAVNFFLLFILCFSKFYWILALVNLILSIIFIKRLKDLLENYYVTVLNVAYLKLTFNHN